MDQDIYLKIYDSALLFRKTLDNMDTSEFPLSRWFDRFPLGCCGDTCNLLAKYLFEQHSIEAPYVWGIRGEPSHAWLEYQDLIIDITADQFDEVSEPVIVTADRTWHSQFVGQNPSYTDFEKFNDYNSARLRMIYNNIIKRINI